MFVDSAFVKIGLVSSIFGAYFGIIFDSAFLYGTRSNLNDTTVGRGLLRLFLGGILVSPLILPYFLLSHNLSIPALFILKTTIPFFTLMFILFSVLKLLFMKLDLVNLF